MHQFNDQGTNNEPGKLFKHGFTEEYMKRIVIDEKVLRGKPIVKGTRISVEFILDLLSSGMSTEQVIKEYPVLKREDVLAVLQYASETMKKEEHLFLEKQKDKMQA
ncbi:MAG: DUF433 domain-containing protein [Candidatus Woesearchaeota archaeon]